MAKKLLKLAGLGLLAGAVAGIFYNQKSGKTNRVKLNKIAKDLIHRVSTEVDGLQKVTKKSYDGIVKSAVADLKKHKELNKDAWELVAQHLRSRWDVITDEVESKTKAKVKTVKKKVAVAKEQAKVIKKNFSGVKKGLKDVKKAVKAVKKAK